MVIQTGCFLFTYVPLAGLYYLWYYLMKNYYYGMPMAMGITLVWMVIYYHIVPRLLNWLESREEDPTGV